MKKQQGYLSILLVSLSGCSATIDCDSIETRKAVLEFVARDSQNRLANFAKENSDRPARETSGAKADNSKPLYELGQRMVTLSTSKDKRTLQCGGAISAAVGDTKATKEINFTVQQSPEGKLSVSVEPFQF